MTQCVICNRNGQGDGANLYRINEYGVKGKWACERHIHLFPKKLPDQELLDLVEAINPPATEKPS